MADHRLYVDESGDHTYSAMDTTATRYLSLTGILFENKYYNGTMQPSLEELKRKHFRSTPDEPVVLVRSRMLGFKGAFGVLKEESRRAAWGDEFLAFVSGLLKRAVVFNVVIDKKDHLARYGQAAFHPYHYCMTVLLERLRGWLNYCGGTADVMAESRGGSQDMELKAVYSEVFERGTYYIAASEFQKVLTSRELKLKKKDANIAGLQLADLMAAPNKHGILNERGLLREPMKPYDEALYRAAESLFNQYGGKLLLD